MNDWQVVEPDDDAPRLPVVRRPPSNFVAPDPPRKDAPIWMQPQPHELMQVPSVQQVVQLTTTHMDRAKGFAVKTGILSVVVGFCAVVAAIVLFRQPFIAAVVLGWFFTSFMLVWVAAYFWSEATSPDGTALFQIFGGFRLLRREQDFRHERIRHKEGMAQPWERKRKGRK